MISRTLFPGRYIQGYGAIGKLGAEAARLGESAFLICSPTVHGRLLPGFREELETQVKLAVEVFGGECSDEEIDRLAQLGEKTGAEVVIGMGGGKVMDTAKAVANRLGMRLVTVPTVASSDAPCSALSILYTREGIMDRPVLHPRNPDVVLVDTRIIAEAPVRFLVAGMGDALSTWFEADSCQRKYAPNMTLTGDVGSTTAYALARLCYQMLLEYGPTAKAAVEAHSVVPAVEHLVEASTLLSGLGFESGGVAAAHGIQIALGVLRETHDSLHGEIVAFGTLVSLFLTDKSQELIDEVYSFCESVGLPTTLADIGLPDATDEALTRVAETAMSPFNPIHNEPIPVTVESIIAAFRAADYEGRLRGQT